MDGFLCSYQAADRSFVVCLPFIVQMCERMVGGQSCNTLLM